MHALYRPLLLAFREPIIGLIALYLTAIYIILFTFLTGYIFILTDTYSFTQGISGLSFVGMGISLCFTSCLVPLTYISGRKEILSSSRSKTVIDSLRSSGCGSLCPMPRLFLMSLFWMGWTARPLVSYWPPLAASVPFGYGILTVFISSYQNVSWIVMRSIRRVRWQA